MFKKLKLLPLVITVLMTGGCIKEDLSMCNPGVSVQFEYTLHNYGGDLFGSEVDNVTIYVFDEDDTYLMSHTPEKYGEDNSTIISLKGNKKYTLVAWGGDMSAYTAGERNASGGVSAGLKKGETALENFVVALKEGSQGTASTPTPLFYGKTVVTPDVSGDPVTAKISLIKDSSVIKFIVTDVTEESTASARSAAGLYEIYCIGENTVLDSGNNIADGAPRLKYTPSRTASEGKVYEAEIDMIRLLQGDDTLMSVVKDTETDVYYLNRNLVELLQEKPAYKTQAGLDKEDLFVIEMDINRNHPGGDGIYIVIKINGWVINPVNPEL